MLLAKVRENRIEIADEFDVDTLLFVDGNLIPTGLRPVAVVIPLQKGDFVFGEKLIEEAFDVVAHIGAREVQNELVARLRARATGKIQNPVRMLAIEIGIRVDHLWLDPQTEIHAERVDFVDERLQTVREFLLIHIPVAEAGVVVLALAEPAIVHHEAIHADGCGLFGQGHLSGFIDSELRGFPGIVNDGTRLGVRGLRQDMSDFKMMQQTRGSAQAVIGIAAIKYGRFEMFTGFEFIAEVEGIETAGDADGVQLSMFNGDAPGAGPRQRAKPDFAVLFAGRHRSRGERATIAGNRKPRIGLMACGSAAAFDDARAAENWFLIQRPLAGPTACQIAEGVARGRQGPLRGSGLFDDHRLLFAIFNVGRAPKDAGVPVDRVAQRYINLARNILQLQLY